MKQAFFPLITWALLAAIALPAQNTVTTGRRVRPLLGPRIEVPDSPTAFTTDGEHLWLGYAASAPGGQPGLLKVRSSDNAVVAQIGLRSAPSSLCWDGSSLWVADGASLTRRVGNLTYSYTVPGGNPRSVAFNGEHLFIVAGQASTTQVVIARLADLPELLPGAEFALHTIVRAQLIPLGGNDARALPIAVTASHVFVGTGKGIVQLIPPVTPGDTFFDWFVITNDSVQAMVYHKGSLMWLTPGLKGVRVMAVDRPETFMGVLTPSFPETRHLPFLPVTLGSDGASVFVAYDNGQVEWLESGRRLTLGTAATAMSFDGNYLWIANRGTSRSRWFLNKL